MKKKLGIILFSCFGLYFTAFAQTTNTNRTIINPYEGVYYESTLGFSKFSNKTYGKEGQKEITVSFSNDKIIINGQSKRRLKVDEKEGVARYDGGTETLNGVSFDWEYHVDQNYEMEKLLVISPLPNGPEQYYFSISKEGINENNGLNNINRHQFNTSSNHPKTNNSLRTQETKQKSSFCKVCSGSGKCRTCYEGYFWSEGKKMKCPNCTAKPGYCSYCKGLGKR